MRRLRRPRARALLVLVLCLALLAVGTVVGVGVYYSNELLQVRREPVRYDLRVLAAARGPVPTVTLTRSTATVRPGVYGLSWRGGATVLGPPTATTARTVTRRVTGTVPAAGTAVRLETSVWLGNPRQARGLPYRDIRFPSPLGPMPAWYVPAAGSTWVVAVHGRGSTRRDVLRILPTLHRLGMPVLSISYRNDEDAPAEPDRLYHLGDREWRDVAAAVAYATGRGARRVVVYAWSMGGALTTAFLQRSPLAARVPAVVLDAPVLDWRATLARQGAQRHLPQPLTWVAEQVVARRIGIRWGEFDLDDTPQRVRTPTLVFHGEQDDTVPIAPARRLARASRQVALVPVPRAGHTQAWNVDPGGYERRVRGFLAPWAG